MVTPITILPVFLMGLSIFGKHKSEQSGMASGGSCGPCGSGGTNLSDKAKDAIKTLRDNGIGYLTAEQLQVKLSSSTPPVLLNVLDADSYFQSHIHGSINVPYTEIANRAAQVIPNLNSEVVVHCASYECPASIEAAKTLKRLGYTNVQDFKGGMQEWTARNFPVEGSGVRQARAA